MEIFAENADHWFFVRQSITWANSNSTLADNILSALKDAGAFSRSDASYSVTKTLNGVEYTMKVETGSSCNSCTGIHSTAYTGSRDFKNRFKMWRKSDVKEALEMLFDSADTITDNGILLNYALGILSPENSNNESLIVESYIHGSSPSRKQTYSWGSPIWVSPSEKASTSTDRGRVVLEEMSSGIVGGSAVEGLGARIAVRTISLSSACGTDRHYYTLAYIQRFDEDFQTTALEGLATGGYPTDSTLCGSDSVKFGIFNGNGFVQDNLNSDAIPSGYPDPGSVYGVRAEFEKIGKVPSGGTGSYDDLQKSIVDTLAPAFRTANNPG